VALPPRGGEEKGIFGAAWIDFGPQERHLNGWSTNSDSISCTAMNGNKEETNHVASVTDHHMPALFLRVQSPQLDRPPSMRREERLYSLESPKMTDSVRATPRMKFTPPTLGSVR
jgi:hypothetical protein